MHSHHYIMHSIQTLDSKLNLSKKEEVNDKEKKCDIGNI